MEGGDGFGFDEGLFSGTKQRAKPQRAPAGYVAKREEPLWFLDQRLGAEERRRARKSRLDHLYYTGQYEAVLGLVAEALQGQQFAKDNSLRRELLETRARALVRLGRHAETLAVLEAHRDDLLQGGDQQHTFHFLRGSCLAALGRPLEAVGALWQCCELSPEHVPCWLLLAQTYRQAAASHAGTDRFRLLSALSVHCSLRARSLLAAAARAPAGWPARYCAAVAQAVDQGVADSPAMEMAALLAQYRALVDAPPTELELRLIDKCLAPSAEGAAAASAAEDIDPTAL